MRPPKSSTATPLCTLLVLHLLFASWLLLDSGAAAIESAAKPARHCSDAYRACLRDDRVCYPALTVLWALCGRFGTPTADP